MQQDDMIWGCIKQGFCSFKIKTKTQILCKNDNNVLGICSKSACPLANSNYATVREHKGVIYLCKKVVERAAFPHKLWEKVRLPENYEEALAQIDVLLPYWNHKQVHRCKQRYTKIYEYLKRARKQATKMRSKKLITLPRKMERREKAREKKALIAAKLENNIELEIMNRVKQGVYGKKYNFADKAVFEKALTGEVEEEEEEDISQPSTSKGVKRKAIAIEVETEKKAKKFSSKYVEDIEDLAASDFDEDEMFASDNDGGDNFFATEDEHEDEDDDEDEDDAWEREQAEQNKKKKAKRMVTIEWAK